MKHPLPPRSVVVGFEPSGRSDPAVRTALDMHVRFGTRFEVVHTVDVPRVEDVQRAQRSPRRCRFEQHARFDVVGE